MAVVEGVAAAAVVAVGVDPPVTPAGVAGLRGEAPPAAAIPLLRGVEPVAPAAAKCVRGVLPLVMGDKADAIRSLLGSASVRLGCWQRKTQSYGDRMSDAQRSATPSCHYSTFLPRARPSSCPFSLPPTQGRFAFCWLCLKEISTAMASQTRRGWRLHAAAGQRAWRCADVLPWALFVRSYGRRGGVLSAAAAPGWDELVAAGNHTEAVHSSVREIIHSRAVAVVPQRCRSPCPSCAAHFRLLVDATAPQVPLWLPCVEACLGADSVTLNRALLASDLRVQSWRG
jgi:hypothetical protein